MSELLISPTPITASPAPQNGNATASALGQGDATGRAGDGSRANAEGTAGAPFASVLKSEMGKKTAGADSANKANASAEAADNAENTAAAIDFSTLFQFLGANPNGTASTATTPVAATEQAADSSKEKGLQGLQADAESASARILAALPATPTAIPDASQRLRNVETKDEALASAAGLKSDGPALASGKIPRDAAINADSDRMSGEKKSSELPAGDFHALIERAAMTEPRAAGLGDVMPAAAGSGSSPASSLRIDTPLGQAGWHDEVGQKLTWMVGNNRQQADLVLTPPHLGRVEVSLTMNGDQATAIFTSANPAVREALEGSLHRLREVLADAGVSLGQTQVGSESPQQSSRKNDEDFGINGGLRYASSIIPVPGAETTIARTGGGRSMVDVFA